MKAIWIICQHAGSPRHGMNYRPYHLARELAALGVDVTVISGSTSHEYYAPPVTTGRYTFEDVDGLRYVWIRTPAYGESRSLGRVKAWAAYLAGLYGIERAGLPKPDAIIVSSPPPYPIVPAARLARRHGAKLVFEVRDLWPLSLVELGNIGVKHPFIRITQAIENYAYSRSDLVVSVLPGAKQHMVSHGLDPGKFLAVPNGAMVLDQATKVDPRVKSAFLGPRFIVGYAGKLGVSNAMDAFVSAAVELAEREDLGFVVIGEGAELERLRELGRPAIDRGGLAFLPRVPKTEVLGMIAAFDLAWVGIKDSPLYSHGISLTKLFDYMNVARPIVLSASAGNDPVSESGCGVTVPPEDARALAAAIVALAKLGRDELERMGTAGRRYLEERHDWKILGNRYHEALFGS